jgi:hypothetical protein
MAALNITSLVKHIDELRAVMLKAPFDLLAINETRLDDNIVHIPVRNDRNRLGGGVAFYIRETIDYTHRQDLRCHSLESISIEISKPHTKSFIVSTWYRPPCTGQDALSLFEQLLFKLHDEISESIVLGDFNCDILNNVNDNVKHIDLQPLIKNINLIINLGIYTYN